MAKENENETTTSQNPFIEGSQLTIITDEEEAKQIGQQLTGSSFWEDDNKVEFVKAEYGRMKPKADEKLWNTNEAIVRLSKKNTFICTFYLLNDDWERVKDGDGNPVMEQIRIENIAGYKRYLPNEDATETVRKPIGGDFSKEYNKLHRNTFDFFKEKLNDKEGKFIGKYKVKVEYKNSKFTDNKTHKTEEYQVRLISLIKKGNE